MRKENSEFKTKFISESGSYLRNADYFAFVELENYACYCVADGIDTDEKQESAKLAVTAVITAFSEDPGISKNKIKQYIHVAHQTLLSEARETRLEASIVIVLTDYKNIRWASAGNSRLVLMRNGRIKFRTRDMSLSQNMADRSEIALDQLETHEERHNLYCYLGQNGHFAPQISGKKKMDDGDIIFLYTRGIWESIGDAELLDAIEGASEPEIVCTGIEDVVLSQQNGILENYTFASIFVNKVYRNPKANKRKKILKIAFSISMAILMVVGMILLMKYRSNKKNMVQMQKYEERGINYLNEINYTAADEQFDAAIELADKINARENTDAYKHAKKIEVYDAVSGYLSEGIEAVSEGEYKKASNKFEAAISSANTLEADYGENIDFLDAVSTYKEFSDNMKNGTEALDASNYEKAVEYLTAASKAADSIDDTANRSTSDELLNTANGKMVIQNGNTYEVNGDVLDGQELYSKALTEYNSALSMYTLAKESYSVPEADGKIAALTIKIDRANDKVNSLSTQEMEKEADDYIQKGNQAAHEGDDAAALEYYESAKEIYQKTNNDTQLLVVNQKIENTQYGADEGNALTNVLDAMSYMASMDYETAIAELEIARDIYREQGDSESATAVAHTISNLKTLRDSAVNFNTQTGDIEMNMENAVG